MLLVAALLVFLVVAALAYITPTPARPEPATHICEIAVYGRALTEDERDALFEASHEEAFDPRLLPGGESLVAYWDMGIAPVEEGPYVIPNLVPDSGYVAELWAGNGVAYYKGA